MIERLQQRIQELKLQQLRPDLPTEKEKTEPNVWDDEPVDVNPFSGENPRYVNRLYQPRRNDRAVDRDDRYRDDPIRSLGLKIEIPEFTWKSKVEAWEKIKKLMKAKFLPENHHQEAFLDYRNLSQQNMTVEEVINEFDKLRMRCDVELKLNELGDELVYLDHGEALVIHRVLNVAILKFVNDNSWLRNNIFRIKCTSKGKIYDMIIDGGSCENVVSTYMVEKLGMKTEAHLKPYQLTWLKKGNTVKVSKRCLVQFSIALKVEKQIKAKSKGSTSRFTPPTRTISFIAPKQNLKSSPPQPRLQ
nr:reverse transcriptase domain-containing protein [Tanacetum cinerariifolium]